MTTFLSIFFVVVANIAGMALNQLINGPRLAEREQVPAGAEDELAEFRLDTIERHPEAA